MAITKEQQENVDICIRNILKNFGLSQVQFSRGYIDVQQSDILYFCVNAWAESVLTSDEINKQIQSKKDYHRLQNLIRIRLQNLAYDLKVLAEETLKSLNVK